MCLNQVDHVFKPSLVKKEAFPEKKADHVFKPGRSCV